MWYSFVTLFIAFIHSTRVIVYMRQGSSRYPSTIQSSKLP
jgi:hypothetical protein